jgi:hypothetical protein
MPTRRRGRSSILSGLRNRRAHLQPHTIDVEPIDAAATYCCLACRLLQPPATTCVHCGGVGVVAPLPLIRDLLRYRDMSLSAERDLGLVTALLAGGSIAVPILMPFALASLTALAVRVPLRRRRARRLADQDVSPVVPAPVRPAPDAVTRVGIARPLYGCSIASIVDDRPMLVEDVALASTGALGGMLFRASRSAPFLLETSGPDLDRDRAIVITGIVRWVPNVPTAAIRRRAIHRGDPLLARLGLPDDLRLDAELAADGLFPDGATAIEVSGVLREERVPELAMYREGAAVMVMRGEPGRPVLVGPAMLQPTPRATFVI